MKKDEQRRPCLCGLLDEGQTCFCEYDDEDWTLLRKKELERMNIIANGNSYYVNMDEFRAKMEWDNARR